MAKYNLTISRDEEPESPRARDNIGKMVCSHKKYSLGDEDDDIENHGESWSKDFLFKIAVDYDALSAIHNAGLPTPEYEDISDGDFEALKKWTDENITVLPLSLYDHSGITMSFGSQGVADISGDWDSGQVGFIYCANEDFDKKHGINQAYLDNNPEWTDGRDLQKVRTDILEGEVESYDTYLVGDVYTFNLKTLDEDGEVIEEDSCCGFYGDDAIENGMIDNFPKDLQEYLRGSDSVNCYEYDSETAIETIDNSFKVTSEIKEAVIEKLSHHQMNIILEDIQNAEDKTVLYAYISGDGAKPYNTYSIAELKEEYKETFGKNIEEDFDAESSVAKFANESSPNQALKGPH